MFGMMYHDTINTDPEKKFTQADIDRVVSERLKREKTTAQVIQQERDQYKQLLEEAQNKEQMTEEERKVHQEAIDALKHKNETAEQKHARELEEIRTKHNTDIEKATGQSKYWETLFGQQYINSEIARYATHPDHEAANMQIMTDLLAHRTVIVPVKDEDGKDIPGKYEAIVKGVSVKEKDGTRVTDLPIAEAFKALYEDPTYAYVFKNKQKGGTGDQFDLNGKPKDIGDLPMEQYLKQRKQRTR